MKVDPAADIKIPSSVQCIGYIDLSSLVNVVGITLPLQAAKEEGKK